MCRGETLTRDAVIVFQVLCLAVPGGAFDSDDCAALDGHLHGRALACRTASSELPVRCCADAAAGCTVASPSCDRCAAGATCEALGSGAHVRPLPPSFQ